MTFIHLLAQGTRIIFGLVHWQSRWSKYNMKGLAQVFNGFNVIVTQGLIFLNNSLTLSSGNRILAGILKILFFT